MKKTIKLLFSGILSVLMLASVVGLVACGDEEESAGGGSGLGEVPYEAEMLSKAEDEIYGYNNNLFYVNTLDFEGADPTIIYISDKNSSEYGYFYAYATSDEIGCHGFQAWRSKDLSHWECTGIALQPDFSKTWADDNYWAPEIMYDAEEGLYYLFYNAYNKHNNNLLYLSVAYATHPAGPFRAPNNMTNANGEELSIGKPVFDFTINNPIIKALDDADETGDLVREQVLDASPFIDPVTGKKYMYFSYYNSYSEGSFIYGVEMKDWFSPDYNTLTMITAPGYTSVEAYKVRANDQRLNEGGVNEGPFMVYRNGKYYMTLSVFGYTNPNYRVIQAIGDAPLGSFTKVPDQKGGRVISTNPTWTHLVSAGHHCFFHVGDEFFIGYHTFKDRNSIAHGRGLAVDKVLWAENAEGLELMHTNGPTWSVQALPEFISGYKNIAPSATITASNTKDGYDVSLLNDELVKYQDFDVVTEYHANEGTSTIKLTWDDWKTVRALMIFNSYDYDKTFVSIKKVEFEVMKSNGKATTAVINNLQFDWDWCTSGKYMRPGGSAIAEFNEMPVKSITITVQSATGYELAISEILVLGKDQACAGIDELKPYSYSTHNYGSAHVERDSKTFGDVEGTSLETWWGYDLSNDDGSEDAYIIQEGVNDQYAYFKDVYSNNFYVEAEFTVNEKTSYRKDEFPKFGIAMTTDDGVLNTIFFYVDAANNYTKPTVGCAQRRLDNSDWDWDTTEQLVDVPGLKYTNGNYVKLAVLRLKEKFYMMCNDQLVIYYDQFYIFNDVRKAAVGFLSFNTGMEVTNYFASAEQSVLDEKKELYARSLEGETFGKGGMFGSTTGWNFSADNGENPTATNITGGDQYAYFKGVNATELYAETEITVIKNLGDPFPKFGLALRSEAATFFYYLDGADAYTKQGIGWVTRPANGDWTWGNPLLNVEKGAAVGSYMNGETVKLGILRQGATVKCYLDDVLVFTVTDLAGFGEGVTSACAVLSFTTGLTISNYSILTDAEDIAAKIATLTEGEEGGGQVFGSAGMFTTGAWDLSNDKAENGSITNTLGADQYAFFKGVNSTTFYAEMDITLSKDMGDQWPKFGLAICNASTTFFFFIDATDNYTAQSVGWVISTTGVNDWAWGIPGKSAMAGAEVGAYKDGESAKLAVKRDGATIECYVNDVLVFTVSDLAGLSATDKAACAVLSFNTGVTVTNYSITTELN